MYNVSPISFEKGDLGQLCMALNLPPFYHCEQGTKASGLAALLIMLHRLAYPDHWRDLVWLFGRVEPELSAIFNGNWWHKRFKHLLESLELIWLNPELFIIAIHKKGAALYNCWDFMDGTVIPIARPTEKQRIMFSGHERVHCIKFQVCCVLCVCQMHELKNVQNVFCPHVVWWLPMDWCPTCLAPLRGDSMMRSCWVHWNCEDFSNQMASHMSSTATLHTECQEISLHHSMEHSWPGNSKTLTNLSWVRISIEWTFGKICQYYSYIDFKRKWKMFT